jgi:hypothetical protein
VSGVKEALWPRRVGSSWEKHFGSFRAGEVAGAVSGRRWLQHVKVRRGIAAVGSGMSASFLLASSRRRYSSHPSHPFATMVEEGIMSEISQYRLRPRARLGRWPSLLSQNGKDRC